MMRRPIAEGPAPVHRVNVAPIIDVALVLVIVLLVTAPLLSVANLDLELPGARTRDVDHDGAVMVSVSRDGELAVDEDVVARADLRAAVASRLGSGTDLVVVRADAALAHETVEQIIKDLREAGAVRVAIATTQKVPRP
jgi:biopolymer transport protein ExbD